MEDPGEIEGDLAPATAEASGKRRTEARAAAVPGDERALLDGLRAGDESAFMTLVERHQASMLRIALLHVATREQAEEVVQETWLAVFEGVARFEGRSSLKTWLFTILQNRAKTRGVREKRSVPLSALGPDAGLDDEGPAVDADRFAGQESRWAGHWKKAPRAWGERPESLALSKEVRARVDAAIAALPQVQREVITLRDIEDLSGEEVCNVLGLSETNQRVILHRARSRVRRALEAYFDGEPGA